MGAAQSSQAYHGPHAVAGKLAQASPTVLAFLSPSCGLCASLRPTLDTVRLALLAPAAVAAACSSFDRRCRTSPMQVSAASSAEPPLQVALINAQLDRQWAPEMLAYQVEAVPCFVLVGPHGERCPPACLARGCLWQAAVDGSV